MIHSPPDIREPRGNEPLKTRLGEAFKEGGSFAEWIAPLQASAYRGGTGNCDISIQGAGDAGNTSSIRQSNGATSKIEHEQRPTDDAQYGSVEDGTQADTSDDKTNDNSFLASIMAACTTREKPKIYLDCDHAGLPLRELDRMARALQDSALAGRPKLSLGIVLPELGEIRFDVQIAGKVVFIHAFVENERAASALALAVSALRDRLEEHRLILGRLDVTSPGGKNQTGWPPGERPISGHRKKHVHSETTPGVETGEEEGLYVLA